MDSLKILLTPAAILKVLNVSWCLYQKMVINKCVQYSSQVLLHQNEKPSLGFQRN